jgi:GTP-binding protein
LIEGAAHGKGLGHDFLRHVERTAIILHLIDAYTEDVSAAYQTVRTELAAYSPALVKLPETIALTKVEGLDAEIINDLTTQLHQAAPKKTPILAISAQSGQGLRELLFAVKKAVYTVRVKRSPLASKPEIPILTLAASPDDWNITQKGDIFIIAGSKIEQFARRTDFDNEQAVQRLRDIMRRAGITSELTHRGIKPGQTIRIGQDQITY